MKLFILLLLLYSWITWIDSNIGTNANNNDYSQISRSINVVLKAGWNYDSDTSTNQSNNTTLRDTIGLSNLLLAESSEFCYSIDPSYYWQFINKLSDYYSSIPKISEDEKSENSDSFQYNLSLKIFSQLFGESSIRIAVLKTFLYNRTYQPYD